MKQKENKTETLFVYREWQSAYNQLTLIKDSKGRVVDKFDKHTNQPRKGLKTLVVKGIEYTLDWDRFCAKRNLVD